MKNALLDGEIVWIDERGHSDFQGLQTALQERKFERLVYYAFDLLFLNGEDLRALPLLERKQKLKTVIGRSKSKKVLYSEHWTTDGNRLYREVCNLQLEGIVSKRSGEPHLSGRSSLWQKVKCSQRQEFVIGGFAESGVSGRPFRALLMGVYEDDGKLRYAGRVGSGFSEKTLRSLGGRMKTLRRKESPFEKNVPSGHDIQWVKPVLVAEVEFKTWTKEGLMRQASFKGLRMDKKPKTIHKEIPGRLNGDPNVMGIKISHPDRVLYSRSKTRRRITKLDVAKYYAAVAPLMMPYLEDRPLSIFRCQETAQANCYFQKHSEGRNLIGISDKPVRYLDKSDTAITVASEEELIRLIQAGTIEIHGWGAQFKNIGKPDVLVFDMDPDTPRQWPLVIETAHEIRRLLKNLNLESFVKVTGGKGVHIQVPIEPNYSWISIKEFSKGLMKVLEDRSPKLFTTNMSKAKRSGRIFLDYLRNGYGSTAIIPYCLRAREKPSVALPISWSEVKENLSPSQFLMEEVLERIQRRKDPWSNYRAAPQRIEFLEKFLQGQTALTLS